jgi:hypothetical protein
VPISSQIKIRSSIICTSWNLLRQMKRIDNGQKRSFAYCRVFKDDLEQIIKAMTVNGEPPQIISGDFEFEGADDLFTFLGERGKPEITIRSRSAPVVSITTELDSVELRTFDSSDPSIAVLHRVSEVFSRCEVNTLWGINGLISLIVSFVLAGSSGLAGQFESVWLALAVVVPTFAVLFVLSRQAFVRRLLSASRFYGVSRDFHKSFWQRKGDDLIVSLLSGVVGAVIGAVLGVAGTLFVQAHTATRPQTPAAQSSQAASAPRPVSPS